MPGMGVQNELRNGTRVRISAAGRGECIGRIEDIRPVDDMPDIPEFAERARDLLRADGIVIQGDLGEFAPQAILREWGVTRHALISFHASPGNELMFTALEIAGEWYDLKRQALTLEVIGQHEWPEPRPN